ncbi:MAG: hypothetical protein WD080_07920 [Egibacteraceae bacterium]
MAAQRVVGGVWRGPVLLAFVAIVMAGCGSESLPPGSGEDVGGGDEQVDDAGEPPDGSGEAAGGGDQAAGGGTALAGTMTGYLTLAAENMITFDEVEVRVGEAAAAARAADGEPPVEEGVVPYLRNPTVEAYEIPVAADVRVQVYDCSGECQLVDWDYRDLVSGASLPHGSPESPFTVTVHDGEVVEITEVYLP